jgi:hypothetical protein
MGIRLLALQMNMLPFAMYTAVIICGCHGLDKGTVPIGRGPPGTSSDIQGTWKKTSHLSRLVQCDGCEGQDKGKQSVGIKRPSLG